MAKKPSIGTTNESGHSGEPTFIDPASAAGTNGSGGGSDGSAVERDDTGVAFDASIHVSPDKRNADGSFRRKRGRRAGSHKSTKKIHTNLESSIEGLTKGLAVFHMALAAATKTPELVLDEDEAKGLATATVNVLDQYDIRPDPKIEAIAALIAVTAATYIPRAAAIKMRREQEKEEKKGQAGIYGPNGFPQGTTSYEDLSGSNNQQNSPIN